MCIAIEEMMEDSKAEGKAEGKAEERAENMRGTIQILRSMDLPHEEIVFKIKSQFHLTDDEVAQYI